jgi:hypothetical protein
MRVAFETVIEIMGTPKFYLTALVESPGAFAAEGVSKPAITFIQEIDSMIAIGGFDTVSKSTRPTQPTVPRNDS